MKKLLLIAMMLIIGSTSVFALAAAETPVNSDLITVKCNGRLTIVEGTIYDQESNEPVGEGVDVTVYCDHDGDVNTISKSNLETNDQGFYTAWTWNILPSRRCKAGDMAWIEVDDGENSMTSDKVEVVPEMAYNHASVNAWVGVPEYTTYTMGLAIVGVSAGLIFLSKKK